MGRWRLNCGPDDERERKGDSTPPGPISAIRARADAHDMVIGAPGRE
jgi:hypothetical protein